MVQLSYDELMILTIGVGFIIGAVLLVAAIKLHDFIYKRKNKYII